MFALVLGVSDIIVKLHDLLQDHEDILCLKLLLLRNWELGAVCCGFHFANLKVLLQVGKFTDANPFLDAVEEGHEGLADVGNNIVLKGIYHATVAHVSHFDIDGLDSLHEGLVHKQLEIVSFHLFQVFHQCFRSQRTFVQYLQEDSHRGHDGAGNVIGENWTVWTMKVEPFELPSAKSLDDDGEVLQVVEQKVRTFSEVAEQHEEERGGTAV